MRAPFRFHSSVGREGHGRAASQAGFTLVELMVAMTGGLFLSIVVFALSRDASRFYQSENRVANATLSGLGGFERLSSDLARAGHLSTPNIEADPRVCNRPQPGWPLMLGKLRALEIDDITTLSAPTEVGQAGINPRRVLITGALNTPEVLTTSAVGPSGGGFWQISIDMTKPSAVRVGLSLAPGSDSANLLALQRIFMTPAGGRIVRLRDRGRDQYAIVQNVNVGPGTAQVDLAPSVNLVRSQAGGLQCGIPGNATAMDLSVIDLVRYDIRSMTAEPSYAALYRASGLSGGGTSSTPAPFENNRAELVRVEIDPTTAQEIPSTREIVAEYAVGLDFSVWRATGAANPALQQVTTALDNTYLFTQLVRGVHVRVSVRSREADRLGDIPGSTPGTQRIGLTAGAAPFARVRTFQADIPLRNLENSNW